jgi:hypothetical protein
MGLKSKYESENDCYTEDGREKPTRLTKRTITNTETKSLSEQKLCEEHQRSINLLVLQYPIEVAKNVLNY